jgi:hypothetical protein
MFRARHIDLSEDNRGGARERQQPRTDASFGEHLDEHVGITLQIRRIRRDVGYRQELAELLHQLGPLRRCVFACSLRRRLRRKRWCERQKAQQET